MCPECHRNDTMVVPARVVQNWEFSKHAVSRQSKAVLTVMLTRPILHLEAENPSLYDACMPGGATWNILKLPAL
jgi:hypothetical protein